MKVRLTAGNIMKSRQLALGKMSQSINVSFPNGKSKFAFPQHTKRRSDNGMTPLSIFGVWEQRIMGHD